MSMYSGVRMDQGQPAEGVNSNKELWEFQLARVLQVQPILLNKQDDTSFALANTSPRDFSRRVQINTVGGKGSVRIKVCTCYLRFGCMLVPSFSLQW